VPRPGGAARPFDAIRSTDHDDRGRTGRS